MNRIISVIFLSIFFIIQLLCQYKPINELITIEKETNYKNDIQNNLSLQNTEKKSVLLAVVASLIIPGMGELYVNSFESGKYHLITEGGLWLTYAGFRIHSNWLGRDARTFANQHAGANFENKDDKFAVNVGNFLSTDEYNQTKLRNREYDLLYTSSQYHWNWDDNANRMRFKDLRIRSDAVKNNSKFVIAAVVINHLISAFSAGRKALNYNKSIAYDGNFKINAYLLSDSYRLQGIGLNFKSSF